MPLEAIEPGPNARRDWARVDLPLRQLAESIRTQGVLEPLVVRELTGSTVGRARQGGRRFRLVAGFRRYAAVRLLGLTQVPVRVLTASDSEAMVANLTENLARADLPESDALAAVQMLRDTYSMGTRQIARATGRSAGWVSELLAVADSREERQAVEAGQIGINAAARLVRLREAAPELRDAMLARLERGEPVGRDDVPRVHHTREAQRTLGTAPDTEDDTGGAAIGERGLGWALPPTSGALGLARTSAVTPLRLSPADESMLRNLRVSTRLATARLYTLHRDQSEAQALPSSLLEELRRSRDDLDDYLASRQLVLETYSRLQSTLALVQASRDDAPANARAGWDALVSEVQVAVDTLAKLLAR